MAATPVPNQRPIFIIGTQRSGTTLMRLILDSHPDIAVGYETGFMRAVKTIKHIPDFAYGKEWYRRWGLEEAEMNERIREFYGGIFAHYAHAQNKRRWGEKTPLNLFQMAEMAAIFPDAQFVCIVRHPGAVIASMMRWKYEFDHALGYWVKANRLVRRTAEALGPDRAFLCRYEDLVVDARGVLVNVMAFLSEPWSDNLLRHHEVQATRGGQVKVEGGTRVDRPLDAGGLDSWREHIDAEQISEIKEQAGGLLRYYGYRAKTAVPVEACPSVQDPTTERL